MTEAFLCDAIRTPIGRYGGALAGVRTDDLAAIPIRALVERNARVDWEAVDDVVYGCANQAGEDNRNVARMALLLAGLPALVAGTTVNRLCGSSLDAIAIAARAIKSGETQLMIAGGVESMSRAPFVLAKATEAYSRTAKIEDTTIGWRFVNPLMKAKYGIDSMPETAENVAEEFNVARADQDAFALRSQQRAAAAIDAGRLAEEIVPVSIPSRKGDPTIVSRDEHPRATTLEALAKLKGIVKPEGTVTAGNASGVNDGACATIVASEAAARRHGLVPRARIVATSVAGVDPTMMLHGVIPATHKVLKRAGLVRQRSKYARAGVMTERPSVKAEAPNEIWTIDFKGWWRSQNGDRCEPLTVRDAYSRFVLAVELVRSTTEAVRVVLERLFKKHGVPKAIQCDNGVPFISVRARGGLTKLSAWWVALGISVIRSRPGCPQDNGGHERMHRDLREGVQLVPAHSHKAQQATCNAWRQEFNACRPHEALDGRTPSELYKPSPRKMLETRAFYPPAWLTRRVSIGGSIRVQMARVPVSLSLIHI